MIVYKFGGTSVGNAERIRAVAELVAGSASPPVVVVSALSGVTDALTAAVAAALEGNSTGVEALLDGLRNRHLEAARGVLAAGDSRLETLERRVEGILDGTRGVLADGAAPPSSAAPPGEEAHTPARERLRDAVRATGEDLSVQLVTAALRARGLDAVDVDARSLVRTDRSFGAAVPLDEVSYALARQVLLPHLEAGRIPVLQGYVGATEGGETTTLGRGGSDFTAALVGAAIGAADVTIWTDVAGIFSADPNHVPGARVLPEIGYEEAVELAWFGAKVIHPAAAKHAVARNVSLRIRNTLDPAAPGTLIRHDRRESPGVAAVAMRSGITLLKVRSRPMFMAYGFLARVFEVLARHRLPVDLVATSHTSTAVTLDGEIDAGGVLSDLEAFAEVEVRRDMATISLVGRGLLEETGILARVFASLEGTPVALVSQASDVSLSFVLEHASAREVLVRLHDRVVGVDR